jgi:hypothetical protein
MNKALSVLAFMLVGSTASLASDLGNQTYCRKVGQLGGGVAKTCLSFNDDGTGYESDTSSGIPQTTYFSYKMTSANTVYVSVSEGRVRTMKISADGSTLTWSEGGFTFVWTRE